MREKGRRAVLLAVNFLLLASVATAQNNRSAVSVTGNDAGSCTVPDPCRTFSVALSKTNPNGEVVALTSGGYGPFTIDKPATIVAAPGIYAALVNTAAEGSAILVNAGASAKVVIRGLHLYGMGIGDEGISVTGTSEEVHVENCIIDGFANYAINASLNVRVSDTTIRKSSFNAISVSNNTQLVRATINRVHIMDSGHIGINAEFNARVTVRDSSVVRAEHGYYTANGQLNIEDCLAAEANNGIVASTGSTLRVSNTVVTNNSNVGIWNVDGTIISWGNNKVQGNNLNKSGTITVVTQD